MSLIKGPGARLVLRAKFKGPREVEVSVSDIDSGSMTILRWKFKSDEVVEDKHDVSIDTVTEPKEEVFDGESEEVTEND